MPPRGGPLLRVRGLRGELLAVAGRISDLPARASAARRRCADDDLVARGGRAVLVAAGFAAGRAGARVRVGRVKVGVGGVRAGVGARRWADPDAFARRPGGEAVVRALRGLLAIADGAVRAAVGRGAAGRVGLARAGGAVGLARGRGAAVLLDIVDRVGFAAAATLARAVGRGAEGGRRPGSRTAPPGRPPPLPPPREPLAAAAPTTATATAALPALDELAGAAGRAGAGRAGRRAGRARAGISMRRG